MSTHREDPPAALQGAGTAAVFGRRLQRLVDVVHPEGRQHYSDVEIATAVGVTAQYISKLRAGKSVPSVEKAMNLAKFFDVENVDYFLKPDGDPVVLAVERRLQAITDVRAGKPADEAAADTTDGPGPDDLLWRQLQEDHGVKEIALRAGQLTPEARAAVLGIVNQILGGGGSTSSVQEP